MKSHISVTIDNDLLADLNRVIQEERRSRSQLIEMAIEEFLRNRSDSENEIVSSSGRFYGRFNREDTYAP